MYSVKCTNKFLSEHFSINCVRKDLQGGVSRWNYFIHQTFSQFLGEIVCNNLQPHTVYYEFAIKLAMSYEEDNSLK